MKGPDRGMELAKIVVLAVVAACVYGVVHDQVTVRVCLEYFTVAHPPVFRTQSPTVLAVGWGVVATWWVGLPLGLSAGLCSRVGSMPRLGWRDLCVPVLWVLGAMAVFSLLAGLGGYAAARAGRIAVWAPLAGQIPPDRHARFLADLCAHNAAYLGGLVGGIVLCIWCVRARRGRRIPD